MPITLPISEAGSTTIEDDGIPGNGASILRRDSDGVIITTFLHPPPAAESSGRDSSSYPAIADLIPSLEPLESWPGH